MTDTTTTDTTEFTRSEITHIVMKAHPALIEAMEKAGQEFYEKEDGWQEEVATHQRAVGMPEQSLESHFGKALKEAAAAVVTILKAVFGMTEEQAYRVMIHTQLLNKVWI